MDKKQPEHVHIKRLVLTDYRQIEELAIDPGTLNVITGGNRKGKSSILKGIMDLVISAGHRPDRIRLDEEKSILWAELTDGTKITRTQTRSGQGTKVVTPEGDRVGNPIAWLKTIIGEAFAFDIVSFYNAKAQQKHEMILRAVDFRLNANGLQSILDELKLGRECAGDIFERQDYSRHGLTVLGEIREGVFERRAEYNRTVLRLKNSVETLRQELPEEFDPNEFAGFNINVAMQELEDANQHNLERAGLKRSIDTAKQKHDTLVSEISNLEKQLADKKKTLMDVIEKGESLCADYAEGSDLSTVQVSDRIKGHTTHLRFCQKQQDIERHEAESANAQEFSEKLTLLHDAMRKTIPQRAMSKLSLPVKGLIFDGDKIYWNRILLEDLCGEEQITLAVQFARALSGRLKLICIDKFEGLDADSRANFVKTIKGDNFQYFVTWVTGGKLGITKDMMPIFPEPPPTVVDEV